MIALDTMKEIENFLKKLDRGVSRKRRNWAKQQKAEVSKLELRSQLGRRFEKMLLEYFENEVRASSSAQLLMAKNSPGLSHSCFLRVVDWSCIWRYELMWQIEVRGQKPACVPDDEAVWCFMQHLSQHQSVGQQLSVDRV